jgi:hypothetical protein
MASTAKIIAESNKKIKAGKARAEVKTYQKSGEDKEVKNLLKEAKQKNPRTGKSANQQAKADAEGTEFAVRKGDKGTTPAPAGVGKQFTGIYGKKFATKEEAVQHNARIHREIFASLKPMSETEQGHLDRAQDEFESSKGERRERARRAVGAALQLGVPRRMRATACQAHGCENSTNDDVLCKNHLSVDAKTGKTKKDVGGASYTDNPSNTSITPWNSNSGQSLKKMGGKSNQERLTAESK